MTRLILQAGFSGDDDLVSPERGYNEFSELGSRQLGRGDVGRIAVSLCRSGIKSSFAFFFPFLLSCIHNSVLPPQKKADFVLWCSPKARHPQYRPSLAFFSAAQNKIADTSCVAAELWSTCNKIDTSYSHGSSRSSLSSDHT
jgi:hypothetical protein